MEIDPAQYTAADAAAIAALDRAARRLWKEAFYASVEAMGTPLQKDALATLSEARGHYLKVNRIAKALGVAYDPRKGAGVGHEILPSDGAES